MFFLSQKSKKQSAVVLIVIFGFVSVFGAGLLRPVTAYAFPVEDISQMTRNVTDQIGSALLSAGLGAVVNGASYFMRKIAYDTAKYVAAGGKGQKPLAFQEGFGKYLANTALDSAGSAIQQFGEPFGLNLCKPPDLRLQIGLQVNIKKIYDAKYGGADGEGGPQPRCDWNDFTENWKNSPDTLFNDQALLEKFNVSLKTSQGDLGVALDIFGKVDNIIAQKQMADQLDRIEGQGFKSVTDIISGDVRTPAQIIKKETDTITGGKQAELSAGQIAGIYGAGAVQILPMALSVFANTLVNSLLQNVLEKGLLPRKGDASSIANFYASTLNSNRDIADAAFSYLIVGIPQRQLTTYDVVTEYSSCSTNPGLNNCVMDSGLTQAVNRARTEAPLTIGEALQQGLLNADWQLISSEREVDNTNLQYCYSSAYCLSNVQKLRRARILPLGFEIAVTKSNPDHPWKLGDVVGNGRTTGFYDCDPSGKPSQEHPYCKLIDPNWIIKAPEARCEVRVNGPELLTPNAPTRREECVDFSTCLKTDAAGKCIGFGYCTQEENTWKMPGLSCDAQFNTCKTYKATNGAIASYLSRTLDVASCTINSVGCLAYSTDKSGDTWKQTLAVDPQLTFAGRTQAVHLNAKASSLQCPSSAEGCSLFVDPDPTITDSKIKNIYLKKAPEYLGCYDVTPETKETIDWPQTRAELTKLDLQKSAACSQFASACIPEEVGCQEYRPADGGIAVTGVIGGNLCPSECVGYETFKQESTTFEPSKFPLNFIASNARTCSIQHVGCDEFTNIGAAAQGGEALEYYTNLKHCELPSGQNGKVFYSWEGSESQGYILKRHTLLQMTATDENYVLSLNLGPEASAEFIAGSPAYVEDTKTALQANYDRCNQASYNLLIHNLYDPNAAHPDCRAFYDSSGGIYYRILRDTVTVSNACTPLRKTNSELFVDTSIADGTMCKNKGGLYESGQCKRCYNGGKYEINAGGIGSCVYQSIQSEATSCPTSANGCRSYIGNLGNNIYEVASFGFEPTNNSVDALNEAKNGWSGNVSVEAESIQVGLHSLRVNGLTTEYTFASASGTLQAGAWYELRFWARGNAAFGLASRFSQNGQTVGNAFTFDPLLNSNVLAPLTTEWQEYHVGPVQFTGDTTKPTQLSFSGQQLTNNQFYFLDNVSLVQIGGASSDHTFLIKNSWRTPEGYEVPVACDATPDDGLPGQALSCRAYTRSDNQKFFLTNFDRLCRAEAVGCRAVVDTQNTVTEIRPTEKQAYGVVCRKSSAVSEPTPCTVVLNESAENKPSYSCTVEIGNKECRIKTPVVLGETLTMFGNNCISDNAAVNASCVDPSGTTVQKDKLYIDKSTVVIRADSDAIYLAQQKAFSCAESQLGCMKVAEEEHTSASTAPGAYTYKETVIKNDPRKYGEVLCSGSEVGCAEFKHDSSLVYFKDPKLTGNSFCVYKQNITVNNKLTSGWFMDGVGTCNNTGSGQSQFCKTDGECGTGKCDNIGVTACYSDYFVTEDHYGLWSQGSPGYKGFVGVCGSNDNGCTELIDRAAVSDTNPKGKPYYAIMNDRLTDKTSQCEGKVSQKEGCVLFDQTEIPLEKYNTAASYADSERATPLNSPVLPNVTGPLDANIILKVERDRQCREWLACKSATTVWDKEGRAHSLCERYAACNEFELGSTGNCSSRGWVNTSVDNTRLTEEKYIKRPTTWSSSEYSGYSLYGAYNPSNYVYLQFPTGNDEDLINSPMYLGYEMSASFFTPAGGFEKQGCRQINGDLEYVKQNGDACGFDDGGRCYAQKCLYPIKGTFTFTPTGSSDDNVRGMLNELQPGTCKSYPETDSPFSIKASVEDSYIQSAKGDSGTTRVEITEKKPNFEQAHVCQFGEKNADGTPKKDCSCEYLKTEYKNGTVDYWPLGSDVPPGICSGDSNKEGNLCTDDSDCGASGIGKCNKVQKKGTSLGLKGLCLEYDYSRPILEKNTGKLFESYQCLTWLPIQVSASAVNLDELSENAGYNPTIDSPTGGQAYCTESTNRGLGYFDTSLETSDVISNLGEFGYYRGVDQTVQNIIDGLYLYKKGTDSVIYSAPDALRSDTKYVFNSLDSTDYGEPAVYKNYTEWGTLMKLIGDDGIDKAKLMRTMQAFAWKNLGSSARVLRLDAKGTSDGDDYRIYYDKAADAPAPAGARNLYAFAPLSTGEGVTDSGVLMHPPRFFSGVYDGDYYMNPGPSTFSQWVGTASFSPDFQAGANHEFIYNDHKAESSLNEADLQSVHFVPMAYPDGSEGFNPANLTTEVSINFFLPENRAEGGAGRVPAYNHGDDDQVNYGVYDANSTMNRVTYLLARDEDLSESDANDCSKNGLLSFCDYVKHWNDQSPLVGQYNSASQDRTRIHHRYVTLIFAPGDNTGGQQFNALIGSSTKIPYSKETDPFQAACASPSRAHRNWLAIGMDFNKDGEFLGYISRWCMNTDIKDTGDANGIRFATIAKLQDRCVEYTAVVEGNTNLQNLEYNKAWTDRVWNGSSYTPGSNLSFLRYIKGSPDFPQPAIKPYGSLPSTVATADILRTEKSKNIPLHEFSDYKFGVPYQCQGGDGFGSTLNNGKYMFESNQGCAIPSAETYAEKNIATAVNGNGATGSALLRNLFLKYYEVRSIEMIPPNSIPDFINPGPSDTSNLVSGLVGTEPPRIFAINPNTCSDANSTCTAAGADAFTVNSRNYTPDEDNDGQNGIDPIIGEGGSYDVKIQFFAYADDNRMPIKRVGIKWGDEPDPEFKPIGLYQNRKPYCAAGDDTASLGDLGRCTGTQLTCKDDTDCTLAGGTCNKQLVTPLKFGDASRACTEHYFEFDHVYNCAAADAILLSDQRVPPEARTLLSAQGVTKVCVYQPGVQILDNWGWCNATAAGCNGPNGSCYNDGDSASCDENKNAFTFYKGTIVVVP